MNDKMLKPKIIFFDNDGTLMDSEQLYYEAGKEVLLQEGIEIETEYYLKNVMNTPKGVFGYAEKCGISSEKIPEMRQRRNRIFTELLAVRCQPIPGAKEILTHFSSQLPMAMVTSSRKRHLDIMHEKTGFLEVFDFLIFGDMVSVTKPDPELYEIAIRRSDFSPEECLAIEDSEHGIASAKKAGIPCVAIPNAFSKIHDYSQADIIIDNLLQLKDIVDI